VNVNEFDIAKKLELTINQARNILYKLSDEGLVSFTRKKDKKNGGWYTYFWTLDIGKSFILLRNKMVEEKANLEHQFHSKEAKRFYYCENCDIEMSEENALIHDFTCPECGEVFKLKDNTKVVQDLQVLIGKIKESLVVVEEQIMEIEKKQEAARQRKFKAEEKKKKIARQERRKVLAKLREKEAKKKGFVKKKIVKRKVVGKKIVKGKFGKKRKPVRNKIVKKKIGGKRRGRR